ncbi:uncharacterized protein [Euphorbia lathyris]|uniref:uncharacterized protein n=1 Tax=Euphorbia lathyris TaxID=212925 RepID=UPI0033142726
MAMLMVVKPWKMTNYSRMMILPSPDSNSVSSAWRTNTIATSKQFFSPLNCTSPLQESLQEQEQVESGIMCEPCSGKGWLLCDFCGGQKTNVKAENKRIYRRCPSCRAIGYVLCQKCKVFKCVTFPNYSDSDNPSF